MLVLYVEDSPFHLRLMQRIVTSLGHELVIAVDGQQGLDLACSLYPDLLLVDLRLPRLDGLTLVRTLRARGCKTPILAITACALSADRQACLEAGCDGYISKPFDVQHVLDLLEAYAARQQVDTVRSRSHDDLRSAAAH